MGNVSAFVADKVRHRFGQELGGELIAALGDADLPDLQGEARDRVHLAVLRWSNGDAARFRDRIKVAEQDWRDVLVGSGLEHADWREVLRADGLWPS